MFKIEVEPSSVVKKWGDVFAEAKIVIDNFSESFLLPISYWSVNDYLKSWKQSISHLINGNKDKAIILTSMYNLKDTHFLHCWIIYKEHNKAILQNKILFKEDYNAFTLENIFEKIPSREVYSDGGEKISEWAIDFEDIVIFYEELDNGKK